MRIYLLRHGDTIAGLYHNADLGVPDPPLDDAGIRQAESLGQRLQHYEIDAVYSFAPPVLCSISALFYDSGDGTWRVERFNDTAHLELATAQS